MNLLVASGIAPPEIGGPATYLEGLLPELRRRGHRVRVLAYGEGGASPSDPDAIRIDRGPLPWRMLRYAAAYRRSLEWAQLILVLGLALPRPGGGRRPVVVRVPGDLAWERSLNRGQLAADEPLERFQATRYGWQVEALKAWRARECRRARLVIAPSGFVRDLVLDWGVGPERVRVVENAVRADAAAAALAPGEARRLLGWEAEGRYLVAAARLTRWKGVDLLIDALADLPGVRLVVAGDGPERGALAARARDRGVAASFCGALARPELALRLRAADYLAVYSGYEGLSHTLLEALALGTPVVASLRGGNPELVRDGVDGLLVPHPDVGELSRALRHAFEPGVRARLARGARERCPGSSWDRFVARTLGVLEEAATEPPGARP